MADFFLTGTLHGVSRAKADDAARRNPPAAILATGESSYNVYYLSRKALQPGQAAFYLQDGHRYELVGDFT